MVAGLRVLLVSDWFPDGPGDPAGSFVRAQALAVARAHEVVVLHLRDGAPGEGRPRLEDFDDGPLRVLRIRNGVPGLPRTALAGWGVLAALRRLRREGFDPGLLHAHEPGAGLAALVGARRPARPVIVSEHASGLALGQVRGVGLRVARIALGRADLVCPVSDALRRALAAQGLGRRFAVVPNPVDTDRFAPGHPPPGDPQVVAVGALVPVKGMAELVEAAGMLTAPFRLHIAGEGPERDRLAARIVALGLQERVVLHGALPAEAVAALLRDASFAVVPSRYETFSVAVSEALACGLPVVATAVGALPERIGEANGLLCPPGDPAALADAIGRMLARHRDYDRAAIAADVRARLAPEAVAARWSAIYAGVTARRGGA
jgi:glycosyltransferase involved in cell wall biosynthesis